MQNKRHSSKDGRYNGKGVSGHIYAGDVTLADIERIVPNLKAGDHGTICKADSSGEDLLNKKVKYYCNLL